MLIFLAAIGVIAAAGIIGALALLGVMVHTQPTEQEEPTPKSILQPKPRARPARYYWTVLCVRGPSPVVQGLGTSRRAARNIKTILDQDEPDHEHRVVRFDPWMPLEARPLRTEAE